MFEASPRFEALDVNGSLSSSNTTQHFVHVINCRMVHPGRSAECSRCAHSNKGNGCRWTPYIA
jgi:hypothetical protein